MKHLHVDPVGGASGDMVLGALLDLGAPLEALRAPLAALRFGAFTLDAAPAAERGLRGTRVGVRLPGDAGHDHDHKHGHGRDHQHGQDRGRGGAAAHGHAHGGRAPQRGLREIRALLEAGALPAAVRDDSLRVFERLAEAEARVHGSQPEEVHFHEVGAADAIVDIVGACLARHALGIASVSVGPFPLGHGTVTCAHGVLPVPAPATVELLKGWPVQPDDEPFELVTPTGAALLTAWRTDAAIPAGARLVAAGHGFGQRTLCHRPNLLRALLFETAPAAEAAAPDDCRVLETNLDDLSPQLAGALLDRLLAAGALDAFLTPIQMKKQRPGVLLTVLCRPDRRAALLDVLFRESTTFGVREYPVARTVLEREHRHVDTPYGSVRVKIGYWQGEPVTAAPEYEDCRRAAARAGAPLRRVIEAAARAAPEWGQGAAARGGRQEGSGKRRAGTGKRNG